MPRLYFVLIVLFISCQQRTDQHPILKYYPPADVLEDGYVNKYYRHYYPKNKDSKAATEINYTKLIKDGDRLLIENFNAGFDLSGTSELIVSEKEIISKALTDIRRRDTIDIEIINPVLSRWDTSEGDPYTLRYKFGDQYYQFIEKQQAVYDTIIDGVNGKVLRSEITYIEEETDEVVIQRNAKYIYLQGLGYYTEIEENEDHRIETELIEQMSVDEFEERADHNKHRIAWINPESTLNSDGEFEICGHERFIADYYNSTPDGRYIHGKRALLDTVYNNLDESKMMEQNGMLIFRFVVNCVGKAGRFTVDGYDFMYQPIKFEVETIQHLYDIIRKLEDWRPVVINEEARDAYFYLNFKIENGKITEILP